MSETTPIKLKKIEVLNDYVAMLLKPLSSTIEIDPDTAGKVTNEGLVIGVGPDVNTQTASDKQHEGVPPLVCGDRIVVRGSKYMKIEPKSGCYADQQIVMIHKPDLVLRHSRANPSEYVFLESWDEQDSAETSAAHA